MENKIKSKSIKGIVDTAETIQSFVKNATEVCLQKQITEIVSGIDEAVMAEYEKAMKKVSPPDMWFSIACNGISIEGEITLDDRLYPGVLSAVKALFDEDKRVSFEIETDNIDLVRFKLELKQNQCEDAE